MAIRRDHCAFVLALQDSVHSSFAGAKNAALVPKIQGLRPRLSGLAFGRGIAVRIFVCAAQTVGKIWE